MIRCVIVQHIPGQTQLHFSPLAFMVVLEMSSASFSSLKLFSAEPGTVLGIAEQNLPVPVRSPRFWRWWERRQTQPRSPSPAALPRNATAGMCLLNYSPAEFSLPGSLGHGTNQKGLRGVARIA